MLAFVLDRRNFREYDQIISVFTEQEGRLDLLAKGVKKITSKNSGNLFLGALLEIDIAKGKEIDRLTKVHPVEIWKNIRKSLPKQLAVNKILNVTNRLVRPDQDEHNIFVWLKKWLSFVNNAKIVNKTLLYCYLVVLVDILGFSPELEECYNCSSKEGLNKFNIQGGLVCRKCLPEIVEVKNVYDILDNEIEIYKILLSGNLEEINKTKLSPKLIKIIKEFIQYHNEIKLI